MPSDDWRNAPPPKQTPPAPIAHEQPQAVRAPQPPASIKPPADPFPAAVITFVLTLLLATLGVGADNYNLFLGAVGIGGTLTFVFLIAVAVEWGVKRAKYYELGHWPRR